MTAGELTTVSRREATVAVALNIPYYNAYRPDLQHTELCRATAFDEDIHQSTRDI